MDTTLTFILLLHCCCVWSRPTGPSVSFSMVFSDGTQLLVEEAANCDEDDPLQNNTTDSGPSVQILSSIPLTQDPESPHLLVCLLTGLNSTLQDVLWWVDDTLLTSADAEVSWMMSEGGAALSATSLWEVSAADWRSRSTFWCGTILEGRVYRQKLCSDN